MRLCLQTLQLLESVVQMQEKNLINMIEGRTLSKCNPKLDGILIALGGKYAAGDLFGLVTVTGRIAYEIKNLYLVHIENLY